jgi:Helix-turn-helix domain
MTTKTRPATVPPDFTRQQRSELADFLRTRRARLSPQKVGLPTGMRREEVAELAGIGITWYTWLEQSRDVNVSTQYVARSRRLLPCPPAQFRRPSHRCLPPFNLHRVRVRRNHIERARSSTHILTALPKRASD